MERKGVIAANDANIGTRLENGQVLTTPNGCSKGDMTAEHLPIVEMNRQLISGSKPSFELPLHLYITG